MPKVSLTPVIFLLAGFALLAKKDRNATAFRFLGPEVVKIDWNARSLHSSDLNGDDLADLVIDEGDGAIVVGHRLAQTWLVEVFVVHLSTTTSKSGMLRRLAIQAGAEGLGHGHIHRIVHRRIGLGAVEGGVRIWQADEHEEGLVWRLLFDRLDGTITDPTIEESFRGDGIGIGLEGLPILIRRVNRVGRLRCRPMAVPLEP